MIDTSNAYVFGPFQRGKTMQISTRCTQCSLFIVHPCWVSSFKSKNLEYVHFVYAFTTLATISVSLMLMELIWLASWWLLWLLAFGQFQNLGFCQPISCRSWRQRNPWRGERSPLLTCQRIQSLTLSSQPCRPPPSCRGSPGDAKRSPRWLLSCQLTHPTSHKVWPLTQFGLVNSHSQFTNISEVL